MNIRATVTDSTHLKLLSPVDLPPGASVFISIDEDTERSDFYSVSSSGLTHLRQFKKLKGLSMRIRD